MSIPVNQALADRAKGREYFRLLHVEQREFIGSAAIISIEKP